MPHKRAKFAERMADRAKKGNDLPPSNDVHFRSMPKGAMRIINAATVQAEYREKKKQREVERAKKQRGKQSVGDLQIREGEKMTDFHRRVESTLANGINSSIRATRETSKKRKRKGGGAAADEELAELSHRSNVGGSSNVEKEKKRGAVPSEASGKELKREREAMQNSGAEDIDWQKAATRRRVGDVVQAPPTLTRAPRGQSSSALKDKAKLRALLTGTEVTSGPNKQARLPDPVQRGGLKRVAMLQEERERAVQAYRRNKQVQLGLDRR